MRASTLGIVAGVLTGLLLDTAISRVRSLLEARRPVEPGSEPAERLPNRSAAPRRRVHDRRRAPA